MTDISALQKLEMQEISSSAAGEIRQVEVHSKSFLISRIWWGTVSYKWWYKRSLNNDDRLRDIWHWEENYDNVKVEEWAWCWWRGYRDNWHWKVSLHWPQHSRLSAARENSSSNVKPKLLQRRQMSSISTSAGKWWWSIMLCICGNMISPLFTLPAT